VRLLVLFDIDGTLVLTGRAGVRGMNLAFRQLYGREGALDRVPIAGRTDRAIVADAMRGIGIEPSEEAIGALRQAYIDNLLVEIGRPMPGHPSLVLPGVVPLIDALASAPDVTTALLTGNFERGALVKLSHFDLWDRFTCGAFGDDHEDRRALLPVAIERAKDAGVVVSPERVVIIGDTPHDIDCAKAHGARAMGVATGPFGRAALEAAGADLALETLEPLDLVMDWLATPSAA
jgi:phosphoglycolate phosphatase-like HAD superfamily hydrolase